jgi:hypothetical protein
MVVKHYIHIIEMKNQGFIKHKVVKHIVKASIEKATLIPHTHVIHGIDDLNEIGHVGMVQSQQHPNMAYKIPLPFTKYVCCTCKWVLRGNLCKHQVVIFLTCNYLTKKNIIQYYGIWCGFNYGGFASMFANLTYLHIYDNEFVDEKANENHFEEPWVVDMCGLLTPNDTSPNIEKKRDHNEPSSSSTPTEKTLARMGDIIQEIINEVKEVGVQLIDHATSLLHVIAIDVRGVHLSKASDVMHPNMVF